MDQTLALNTLAEAAETANLVVFKVNQGLELQGAMRRLSPQSVTFEIHGPLNVLRLSEVLPDFQILANQRRLYVGTATVTSLVNTGTGIVCEASLNRSLLDVDLSELRLPEKRIAAAFASFLQRWQKHYRISPEYKIAVADLQSFLHEMRMWLDQIELGIRALPSGPRAAIEREVVEELRKSSASAVASLFERFESVAGTVPAELVPAHAAFCRQQLHPLLMCSPFMHRITSKPLGYAGDYEMVSMILRDPFEGASLFAKLLNVFILSQVPAEAHRNRVLYLVLKLVAETHRVRMGNRVCRVFSLGCGPANEVERFLREQELSAHAQFTLLDANEETLQHAAKVLERAKTDLRRATPIRLVKKSVQQLIKAADKSTSGGEQHDFIYCAGLFDYLSDRICRSLISLTYDQLAPGGLLLITNVDPVNPIRNIMEQIYEWHLNYRRHDQLRALTSHLPSTAAVSIQAETTSSNIFLEIRKPA